MAIIKLRNNEEKDNEIYEAEELYEPDQEIEQKVKRRKRRKALLGLSVVAIILIAALLVRLSYDKKIYKDYKIVRSIKLGETYGCQFYEFGKNTLRYSNDGITYINEKDTVWNQPFEMKSPLIDVCRATVAIAEYKGNTIYICNQSGAVGQVSTKYPIESIEVSDQGIVAAITFDQKVNYIEVYDKAGNQLAEGRMSLMAETGHPTCMSISPDGTKLAVGFLYVDGSEIKSKVVFYNFSEVGKNNSDRIMGVFGHYDKSIVADVEFVDNNTIAAFGSDIVTIYNMKQKPSIKYEKEFGEKVRSVFYSKNYIGIVYATEDSGEPYKIEVMDKTGRTVFKKKIGIEYTNIKFDGDNVVVYSETELEIYAFNGTRKYKTEWEEKLVDILVTDKEYQYTLITSEGLKTIQLK